MMNVMNPTHPALPFLCVMAGLLGAPRAQYGWVQRTPVQSPGARGANLIEYDLIRGMTVVFGGYNNQVIGGTWEWDGTNWSQRLPATSPPPQDSVAHAYDIGRGRVVMFGGRDVNGTEVADTWEWSGTNWSHPTPAVAPPARQLAGMAYHAPSGRVVLFGGAYIDPLSGLLVLLGDTWEWNGTTWTQRTPAHSPAARWAHGMAADLGQGTVLVQGGSTASIAWPATFTDTWSWDGTDWQQINTANTPSPLLSFGFTHGSASVRFGGASPIGNETWLLAGDTWVQDPGAAPPPRWDVSMTFDIQRDRVVLFGGLDPGSNGLADTWEYAIPPLATVNTFGAGCAGSAGVPLLAAQGGARPVLGAGFPLELSSLPSNAFVGIALGFSNAVWSGGTLPASLAAVGMPGCTLFISPDALFLTQASAAGIAVHTLTLPNAPVFAGTTLFGQAMSLDPGVNALGAVVSNAVAATTGVL
jgi:hypothetical protein